MTVPVRKCLKRVPYLVTPPTFDSLVNMYENHILYIFFDLLPFSYNASAYKDHNQNWCVIGNVKVQNYLFTYFLAFLGQFFFVGYHGNEQ